MGKWTPDYIDDVLLSKIKIFVSGAIKRVTLEKTEPSITYEDFVHDLDTGDSFTTSLIEVLVKELAERRARPVINDDRRTITDRSARSLQQLAERNPNYRVYTIDRHFPHRRSATLTDYLTAPPLDMDLEGDEDMFGHIRDTDSVIEGARINSDLYDAYGGGQSTRRISSPSPPTEEATSPVPQSLSQAHFRSGPWSTMSSGNSSALTRQPSIRRHTRSRTVDFNEFTRRRRSSIRENQNARRETNESSSHWDSWDPFPNPQPARRFFPVFRTRRFESLDSWNPVSPLPHDTDDSPYVVEPPIVPWFSLTPPVVRDQEAGEVEISDERAQAAPTPRLRRAGARAPGSVLSRHGSPIPTILSPRVVEDATPLGVELAPDDTQVSVAEPTSYPTPSSTEHEFFA